MADLNLSYFGRFHASLDGQPIESFRTIKVQALLIYLTTEAAFEGPKPHQRDTLVGLLWPDLPNRSARINLRQIVY